MMTAVAYFPATDPRMAAARRIRKTVFCDEQRIPADLEWDGEDLRAEHVLLEVDRAPAGAARLRTYAPGVFKVERVAVTRALRGRGLGAILMQNIMETLARRGASSVVLNAQISVEGFYHRLGFTSEGEPFVDAGIPHVHMVWRAGR
jgi:predicted GNAT family N-acyltransferase